MNTPIFLFPGQSSTQANLFGTALEVNPEGSKALLSEAAAVLGFDVARRYEGADFPTNHSVQVGVFIANCLHLRALQDHGVDASLSLGLSLGEYAHLVHIGAVTFADALRLVDARGRAYDDGPDGTMAAVYPISPEELEPILEEARKVGFVAISNANAPTQQVIAGERAAVAEALRLLDEELFIAGKVIEERVPMHTERFRPVAESFGKVLESTHWRTPDLPYLPNVTGQIVELPTDEIFVARLSEHVYQPVLWQRSIDMLRAQVSDAAFVEVGPRTVLHDMMRKQWTGNVPRFHTATPDAFFRTVSALTEIPRIGRATRLELGGAA